MPDHQISFFTEWSLNNGNSLFLSFVVIHVVARTAHVQNVYTNAHERVTCVGLHVKQLSDCSILFEI